jgi:hypothetical protein
LHQLTCPHHLEWIASMGRDDEGMVVQPNADRWREVQPCSGWHHQANIQRNVYAGGRCTPANSCPWIISSFCLARIQLHTMYRMHSPTYKCSGGLQPQACIHLHDADRKASDDRSEGRQRRPTRSRRPTMQTGQILEASDAGRQLSDWIVGR